MRHEIKHYIDVTNSTCLRGIVLKTPNMYPKGIGKISTKMGGGNAQGMWSKLVTSIMGF